MQFLPDFVDERLELGLLCFSLPVGRSDERLQPLGLLLQPLHRPHHVVQGRERAFNACKEIAKIETSSLKRTYLRNFINFRNCSHNTEGQLKESEHQTRSSWNSNCKAHLPNCGLIGGSILAATSIFKVRKLVGISRLIEMTRKWLQSHAKRRG